tara:strand:- start:179 stop:418 length:240 start_codon:yes stop_codon:yes gene_type:complete
MTKEEKEIECFGETEEALMAMKPLMGENNQGWGMLNMSILSDAQEAMERGQLEAARQLINKAKWIISREWMGFKEEEDQ